MALSKTDKDEIEKIVKKEIKDFLTTTDAQRKVVALLKKEYGKDLDDKMVDIATKCIVELFRQLWTKKNFWEGSLKNVKP